jgi:CRISPR-associated endonuclease/helicase Cas3
MEEKMRYAHSANIHGHKEPVIDHLYEVARLASDFAAVWNQADEALCTGFYHDLGKYGDLFQQVLSRQAVHVDHAAPGAVAMLNKYGVAGLAGAIAIQGHHDGLITGLYTEFKKITDLSQPISYDGKKFSSIDVDYLLNILEKDMKKDKCKTPTTVDSKYPELFKNNVPISAMLYIRMLYSALVDADFLATEAHFAHDGKQYVYRSKGIKLHPDLLLERLNQYVHDLSVNSKANKSIVNLRNDLYDCCLQASDSPQGIYTLTAPTGAGKTLAMMAFALGHCRRHGLKRIIIVLPFLNIIDQSAQAYERVFSETSEDSLILQDHSLAEAPDGDISRLLAQNWDAPIVITTTVRFFEALFANRSTSCRRLHNIARSVVIFDEAQVMPQSLVIPTLAALSFLSQNFGCTTVFSTATQPAFESFDSKVSVYCEKGWRPKEIVTKQLNLFKRARRVKVQWPKEQKSWENICSEALTYPTILVITNLRKHALNLYRLVSVNKPDETFHLSTNMCPAHRLDVLKEVIKRLKNKENCTLISTQCVEAGVDLDFPVVWRAMAPLEAIAQAAGRCNREGQLKQGGCSSFHAHS